MLKETSVLTNSGIVGVKVQPDGFIAVSGLRPFIDTGLPAPLAIWKTYVNYREGDKVVRSGHGLCGVYDFSYDKALDPNYVENDTMHSSTAEEVANNIFRFFPSIFPVREQKRIIDFLRYHDLGESKAGDKPDDGSTSKDEKVSAELEEFIRKVQYLPSYIQEQLIRDFVMFEHADFACWEEESKRVMQFAKLCDKVDAPLAALLFEKQGRKGDLNYKLKNFGSITEQDQNYIDQMHESSQAAVWTAHMLDKFRDYENLDLFAEIVVAACRDVRGFVFPGLYEFLKKNDIFSEDLRCKLTK